MKRAKSPSTDRKMDEKQSFRHESQVLDTKSFGKQYLVTRSDEASVPIDENVGKLTFRYEKFR